MSEPATPRGVVLVTGASGYLGRQVVELLLGRLPATRVAALARRPEALADLEYVKARVEAGMPEPFARFTAAWFRAIAAGEFAATGDIERLIGRPPTSVRELLAARRS